MLSYCQLMNILNKFKKYYFIQMKNMKLFHHFILILISVERGQMNIIEKECNLSNPKTG